MMQWVAAAACHHHHHHHRRRCLLVLQQRGSRGAQVATTTNIPTTCKSTVGRTSRELSSSLVLPTKNNNASVTRTRRQAHDDATWGWSRPRTSAFSRTITAAVQYQPSCHDKNLQESSPSAVAFTSSSPPISTTRTRILQLRKQQEEPRQFCHYRSFLPSSKTTTTTTATSVRCYHATPQREILPLIGAAAVLMIGRYTYKALSRMDDEWEEYQWQLQRYEKLTARQKQSTDGSRQVVLAMDVGSVYTKMAATNNKQRENATTSDSDNASADIVESREGDRFVFNGVILGNGNGAIRGRAAMDRFSYYYVPNDKTSNEGGIMNDDSIVQFPTWPPQHEDKPNRKNNAASLAEAVLAPALLSSLERIDRQPTRTTNSGNSAPDESRDNPSSSDPPLPPRLVVTLPAAWATQQQAWLAPAVSSMWKQAIGTVEEADIVYLPDAVAAVWGAQAQGLLPDDDVLSTAGVADNPKATPANDKNKKAPQVKFHKTIVIDVGGFVTQVSLVNRDVVQASLALQRVGGEGLQECIVDWLMQEINGEESSSKVLDQNARMALSAALQVQARTALPVLSTRPQVSIHVPSYLLGSSSSVGRGGGGISLSRSVLDQVVNDTVPLLAKQNNASALSQHLPAPKDVTALWTSVLTQLLEVANETPRSIDHILVVGGGGASSSTLVQGSVTRAWSEQLQGQQAPIFVDYHAAKKHNNGASAAAAATPMELVALGATTMLPSYTYDLEQGLQQRF